MEVLHPNKMKNKPLLSLHLNVYNEEKNLEKVFKEIKNILEKAKISYEIIFVEGGSKDKSWEVLQNLAKTYKNVRVFRQGFAPGEKLNKGMKEARGKYFGYMCSDGQDDPKLIPQIIKLLEEKKADFVKARRVTRVFWERKFISSVYNAICRNLFGLTLRDINMHPKIFKRDLVKNINLISKGESVDLEIVLRANKKGFRFIELPIKERVRDGGSSSVGLPVMLSMIRDMLSYKWGNKSKRLP